MNRSGIIVTDVRKPADMLGEYTPFRKIVSKVIPSIVTSGKWFGFCKRIDDAQVDIFSLENDQGEKMGRLIYNIIDSEDSYRTTLYRYLLHDYLCYCEIPTVIRQKDVQGVRDSYDKSLVTSNINVVAHWLDISVSDAKALYGARLEDLDFDRDDGMFPYVKLTVAKDGTRKVTRPRKDIDLSVSGIRVIPMFALSKGVEVLYKMCSKDFYDVSFLKDSGQRRVINICFDYDKLCSVYSDKGKLSEYYEEQFTGDYENSSSFHRGYIRAIEVGTSLSSFPVRSINVARIVGIEKKEPDLTFINICLDTVKSSFLNMLSSKNVNYKELSDMLEIFQVGSSRQYNGREIGSYADLESWVEAQELLLSTPFIKQLALFMIGNPQWFAGYTGEEVEKLTDDSGSDGDDGDPFWDDLDFE